MNRQRSSEMNNIGVECLDRRDFRQALDSFRCALQQTQSDSEALLMMADQETGKGRRGIMVPPQAQLLLYSVGSFLPQAPARSEGEPASSAFQAVATSHDGGSFLLYTQGLRVLEPPTGGSSFSQDPHEENMIHSAVIVFNLALTFHLASLQPGCDTQNKWLGKAQSLYQKSCMLIADIRNAYHGKSTGTLFVDLLAMTVWNNQAHIQLECYFDLELSGLLRWQLYGMALDVKKMIEREKRVSLCHDNNSIISNRHHYPNHQETVALLDQHMDSFLSNAAVLGLSVHTSAPAA
jgi:hypothetical protein